MRQVPSQPFTLSQLGIGNVLSYESERTNYHYRVIGIDERQLPVVEISASHTENPGYSIVEKINAKGMRGIILGSCELKEEVPYSEGLIVFGKPNVWLAIEMILEGEIDVSIFPAPNSLEQIKVS